MKKVFCLPLSRFSLMILLIFWTVTAFGSQPGSKSADGRFWDYGQVILDRKTQLMWFKQDYWQLEGKHLNWYEAQEYLNKVNNKKYYGYSDWRLPTPEEAESLYQRRKRNLDKDGDKFFIDRIFPIGAGWATWTSKENGKNAVVVSYKDEGWTGMEDKIEGTEAFLRPVRIASP